MALPQARRDINIAANIDRATLTPLVHRALNRMTVEIDDWECHPLHGGFEVRAGIYRFAGSGHAQGEPVAWSLILKVICPPPDGTEADPNDWNYLERERLVYQSGLLDDLPGGIVAPRCFAVFEPAQDEFWIWLEDVLVVYNRDDMSAQWSLERYRLAARHLGQFNGAYLCGRALPTQPWLSCEWLRVLVAQAAPAIADLPHALEHPLMRRLYPSDVFEGILRLWAERETFLAALDHLPQTFCHRDAFRRNLFAQRGPEGRERTFAIDWVFAGTGAVGEEVVPLVVATLGFREVDLAQVQELERIVFDGYLAGLCDAGWNGDSELARLGYTAAAPLRYLLGGTRNLFPILLDESRYPRMQLMWGDPIEVFCEHWANMFRYLLVLADEARGLLTKTKDRVSDTAFTGEHG